MRRNTLAARALTAAVLTALLAGAAPVLAIEGHRPIHERRDIFEPGYYKFTRNVTSSGSPIITVSVGPEDRVVIDLNCFTATQQSTNVPVIFISSGGNIVIKNGELRNGTYGIDVFPGFTDSVTVSDMVIGNSGVDGIAGGDLNNFKATNVDINLTGNDGINLTDVDNVKMDDVMIGDVGDDGLEINGGVVGTTGQINRVTVTNSGQDGAKLVNTNGLAVNDYVSENAGRDGLHVSQSQGGHFRGLTLGNSARDGLRLQDSLNIRAELFASYNSAQTGIFTNDFCSDIDFITGSVSGSNKGMELNSDRTTVRGVDVTGNTQAGIHQTSLASDTVVRETTSIGNTVWDLLVEGINLLTFGNLIGTTGP